MNERLVAHISGSLTSCVRTTFVLAFLCGFSILFYPGLAMSQSQVDKSHFRPITSLKSSDLTLSPDFNREFNKWKESIKKGDAAQSDLHLKKIKWITKHLGSRNFSSVARMCVAIGKRALKNGKTLVAILAGEAAVVIAPDDPQSHFFLALATVEHDMTDVKSIAAHLASGARAIAHNRILLHNASVVIIKYVSWAALVTFVLIFLTIFFTHFASFKADIATLIPSRPEGVLRTIIGLIVAILPFAFGGWLLAMLAISLVIWPYIQAGGRAIVVAFTLFIFSAPFIFDYSGRSITMSNADAYRAVYLLSQHTWDRKTELALEREKAENPGEIILFASGLKNKFRKDYHKALEEYDALLRINPSDVRALVNKGNIFFITKRYDKAVEMYKLAIKIDPQSVETRFNLSNTYVMTLKTKEAESEYKMASSINQERVKEFVNQTSDGDEKQVIDFLITREDLNQLEEALEEKSKPVTNILWRSYFGPMSINVYQGISLAFAMLVLFSHFWWNSAISSQTCSSCGAAFRPPLLLDTRAPQCNQCVASSITRGGIPSAKKDKKIKEIRYFKDRKVKKASVLDRLIPGLGRIYIRPGWAGFFVTFVTSLIVSYGAVAIFRELVLYKTEPEDLLGSQPVYLGVVAVYWIMMNTLLKKDHY